MASTLTNSIAFANDELNETKIKVVQELANCTLNGVALVKAEITEEKEPNGSTWYVINSQVTDPGENFPFTLYLKSAENLENFSVRKPDRRGSRVVTVHGTNLTYDDTLTPGEKNHVQITFDEDMKTIRKLSVHQRIYNSLIDFIFPASVNEIRCDK